MNSRYLISLLFFAYLLYRDTGPLRSLLASNFLRNCAKNPPAPAKLMKGGSIALAAYCWMITSQTFFEVISDRRPSRTAAQQTLRHTLETANWGQLFAFSSHYCEVNEKRMENHQCLLFPISLAKFSC